MISANAGSKCCAVPRPLLGTRLRLLFIVGFMSAGEHASFLIEQD